MDAALKMPNEIYKVQNELKEEIFALISHIQDQKIGVYHIIVLCFLFNRKPSFVLLSCATKSTQFLKEFQLGELIKNPKDFLTYSEEEISEDLSGETVNILEHHKSTILAELLTHRKETDISFELFPSYDAEINLTLESPDEVYIVRIDRDTDQYTYIKSFEKNRIAHYYIVIALKFKVESVGSESHIPLLSFPTIDGEVYRHFAKGKLHSGTVKS